MALDFHNHYTPNTPLIKHLNFDDEEEEDSDEEEAKMERKEGPYTPIFGERQDFSMVITFPHGSSGSIKSIGYIFVRFCRHNRLRRGWPRQGHRNLDDGRFNSFYASHHDDNYLVCRWVDNDVVKHHSHRRRGNPTKSTSPQGNKY